MSFLASFNRMTMAATTAVLAISLTLCNAAAEETASQLCRIDRDLNVCPASSEFEYDGMFQRLNAEIACPLDTIGQSNLVEATQDNNCECDARLEEVDGTLIQEMTCECFVCPAGSRFGFAYSCEQNIAGPCHTFNCAGECNGEIVENKETAVPSSTSEGDFTSTVNTAYVLEQVFQMTCDALVEQFNFLGTCCSLSNVETACILAVSGGHCEMVSGGGQRYLYTSSNEQECPVSEYDDVLQLGQGGSMDVPLESTEAPTVYISDLIQSSAAELDIEDCNRLFRNCNFSSEDTSVAIENALTVFCPNSKAVSDMNKEDLQRLLEPIWQRHACDFVLRHITFPAELKEIILGRPNPMTMMNGELQSIHDIGNFVAENLFGPDGILHIIDQMFLPSSLSNNIYNLIEASPDHASMKESLMGYRGLMVRDLPFTVFAKSNNLWNMIDPLEQEALVQQHIFRGLLFCDVLATLTVVSDMSGVSHNITLEGESVFMDGERISKCDVLAKNGVVHFLGDMPETLPPTIIKTLSPTGGNGTSEEVTALPSDNNTSEIVIFVDSSYTGTFSRNGSEMVAEDESIVSVSDDSYFVVSFVVNLTEVARAGAVEFCLEREVPAVESDSDQLNTYSVCLLLPDLTVESNKDSFAMPKDCVGGVMTPFTVNATTTEVCVNVSNLVLAATQGSYVMDSLPLGTETPGNLRKLQQADATFSNISGLTLMVDNGNNPSSSGDRFYSNKDVEGRGPALSIKTTISIETDANATHTASPNASSTLAPTSSMTSANDENKDGNEIVVMTAGPTMSPRTWSEAPNGNVWQSECSSMAAAVATMIFLYCC
jgi:uncharacterized surface protein with fasciclin (FAS1) repeats